MNILLAVDGSQCALRAARLVAELFGGREAHVDIVNVQDIVHYGELLPSEVRLRIERWHEEQGRLAAAAAQEVLTRAGIAHDLRVVSGDPGSNIAQAARDRGCRLIVMGSRGHGPLAGAALGSVAARVIHLADVPVTVVK